MADDIQFLGIGHSCFVDAVAIYFKQWHRRTPKMAGAFRQSLVAFASEVGMFVGRTERHQTKQ